jgi:hypothetical protein
MAATRAQFNTLFSQIMDLDAQKKEIGERIKEAFGLFADNHSGLENTKPYVKALKKGYRNYKEIQKDRTEFILVESDTDTITEALLTDEPTVTTPQGE